jgi:hypothetical protein
MAVRDTTGVHTVTMADDGTFGEAIYREALMSPVWRDGELLRATPFAQVRENAALS